LDCINTSGQHNNKILSKKPCYTGILEDFSKQESDSSQQVKIHENKINKKSYHLRLVTNVVRGSMSNFRQIPET